MSNEKYQSAADRACGPTGQLRTQSGYRCAGVRGCRVPRGLAWTSLCCEFRVTVTQCGDGAQSLGWDVGSDHRYRASFFLPGIPKSKEPLDYGDEDKVPS